MPPACNPPATTARFAEGFKITDVDAMATHGVDREALMARLVHIYGQPNPNLNPNPNPNPNPHPNPDPNQVHIYGQQLFVDGFFNADPHAGNLMVQVRDGTA